MSSQSVPHTRPGQDHRRDLSELQSQCDYVFETRGLLERALTHRSYMTENDRIDRDNQRLEYLGDAVLGLIVAEALFRGDEEVDEGILSKRQSHVVRRSALARVGRQLDLGGFLRLGKGEVQSGGRQRESLLADAYEALLGAIYLDGGFGAVKRVVLRLHEDLLEEAFEARRPTDFKSRLQEFTQKQLGLQPGYRIVSESGPAHDKTFVAEVAVGEECRGTGEGRSKQEAEQRAAGEALEQLQSEE